jgi:hypothetical protein
MPWKKGSTCTIRVRTSPGVHKELLCTQHDIKPWTFENSQWTVMHLRQSAAAAYLLFWSMEEHSTVCQQENVVENLKHCADACNNTSALQPCSTHSRAVRAPKRQICRFSCNTCLSHAHTFRSWLQQSYEHRCLTDVTEVGENLDDAQGGAGVLTYQKQVPAVSCSRYLWNPLCAGFKVMT